MSIQELSKIDKKIKHWYIPMAIGVLAIFLGVWIFFTTKDSLISLNVIFAVIFLILGLLEVAFAFINKKTKYWIAIIILGIINFIFGIILLIFPDLTTSVLTIMLGFVMLVLSINNIKTAINIKTYDKSAWFLILSIGFIDIILSIVLFINPFILKLSETIVISVSLIIMGALNIMYSLKLKNFHK